MNRPEDAQRSSRRLFSAVAGLEHVYVIAILVGGYAGFLPEVLLGVVAYVVIVFVVSTAMVLHTAWQRE